MTDWQAVRRLVPEVLGALVRRYGLFDACEDAVQEALVAATTQWPVEGWPESPRAWLTTVATRRLADQVRSDVARQPAGGGGRDPHAASARRPARCAPTTTPSRCCSCAATRC